MKGIKYKELYKNKGLKNLKLLPELISKFGGVYGNVNKYLFVTNRGYKLILGYECDSEKINKVIKEYAIIETKKEEPNLNEPEYEYQILIIKEMKYEYYTHPIVFIYCDDGRMITIEFYSKDNITIQFYVLGTRFQVDKVYLYDLP